MSKKKQVVANEKYYSKLIVYKRRKYFLAIFVTVFTVAFTSILFNHMLKDQSWLVVAGPILILGFILCLFPHTEEWQYVPWQSHAEKHERTTTNQYDFEVQNYQLCLLVVDRKLRDNHEGEDSSSAKIVCHHDSRNNAWQTRDRQISETWPIHHPQLPRLRNQG